MNEKNLEILRWLQRDGSLSMDDLAERVSLSKTAVWRRVKKLEEDGVIRKTMAVIDEKAVGFGVTVFTIVRTNQHNDAWYESFADAVRSIPEVMDVYRASGDIDYILRIIARDMAHYDEVYRRLIRKCEFSDVSSTFVMETIKESRELPL